MLSILSVLFNDLVIEIALLFQQFLFQQTLFLDLLVQCLLDHLLLIEELLPFNGLSLFV